MVDVLVDDVSKPEGPVILSDREVVITEMGRGRVTQLDLLNGTRRTLAETGRPNGLARDAQGNLWIAESRYPGLLKWTPDHQVQRVISEGLLWPNDLCFGPDGALYMTDSGILLADFEGIQPPEAAYHLPVDGKVLRIDPRTSEVTTLVNGLRFANGIAFRDQTLYYSETLTGNIYALIQGQPRLFANVMLKPPPEHGRVAGPDGMAFDREGNLYVAVLIEANITVIAPDGTIRERLPLPGNFPTNVAFLDESLIITEAANNQLLRMPMAVSGLPLYE